MAVCIRSLGSSCHEPSIEQRVANRAHAQHLDAAAGVQATGRRNRRKVDGAPRVADRVDVGDVLADHVEAEPLRVERAGGRSERSKESGHLTPRIERGGRARGDWSGRHGRSHVRRRPHTWSAAATCSRLSPSSAARPSARRASRSSGSRCARSAGVAVACARARVSSSSTGSAASRPSRSGCASASPRRESASVMRVDRETRILCGRGHPFPRLNRVWVLLLEQAADDLVGQLPGVVAHRAGLEGLARGLDLVLRGSPALPPLPGQPWSPTGHPWTGLPSRRRCRPGVRPWTSCRRWSARGAGSRCLRRWDAPLQSSSLTPPRPAWQKPGRWKNRQMAALP